MDTFIFLTLAIIAYAGLFAGVWLGRIAISELKDGRKYLRAFQIIMYLITASMAVYGARSDLMLSIALGAIFLLLLFMDRGAVKPGLFYSIMPVVFFLPDSAWILAGLVFLYGLPTGSLMVERFIRLRGKKYEEMLPYAFAQSSGFLVCIVIVVTTFGMSFI